MSKPFETPTARYDSFPLISSFSRDDMTRAQELIGDDLAYQEEEDAVKEARAHIKAELAEIAERNDVGRAGGFRHGQVAVYYRPGQTRRTLKAELLVERSYCTAEQIDECKVAGKPFLELRVVDLTKPSGRSRQDREE